MMTFNLNGWMVSGKNSVKGDPVDGHKYPNPRFEKWRNMMSRQVWVQRKGLKILFKEPVRISVRYYPADKLRRDATGVLDALFHLMEITNVVADDALFKVVDYQELPMDRLEPKVIIQISKIDETILE